MGKQQTELHFPEVQLAAERDALLDELTAHTCARVDLGNKAQRREYWRKWAAEKAASNG